MNNKTLIFVIGIMLAVGFALVYPYTVVGDYNMGDYYQCQFDLSWCSDAGYDIHSGSWMGDDGVWNTFCDCYDSVNDEFKVEEGIKYDES